jgi:hypothetical protein
MPHAAINNSAAAPSAIIRFRIANVPFRVAVRYCLFHRPDSAAAVREVNVFEAGQRPSMTPAAAIR